MPSTYFITDCWVVGYASIWIQKAASMAGRWTLVVAAALTAKRSAWQGDSADTMRAMRPLFTHAILIVFALAAAATAQTMPQRGYEPVDQTVEDIDPLGVSLRQREAGLNVTGEQGNVFRRIDPRGPADNRLLLVNQGVFAEFDRSNYAALIDRRNERVRIFQLIPANTVFHIGMPKAPTTGQLPAPYNPGQVDGRVTQRYVESSTSWAASEEPTQTHQELVVQQRAVVVAALDRIAKSPPVSQTGAKQQP
jgi:hypothetical protein